MRSPRWRWSFTRAPTTPAVAVAVAVAALPSLLGACGRRAVAERPEVVVYTSVDQVFSEPVFKRCATEQGLTVRPVFDTEETKSTGVLNRLLAEAGHPQADVFWSGDPVRASVLVARHLAAAYRSPAAAGLPPRFVDADGRWTGLSARARVLLVNTDRVPADALPTSIQDLAAPRWRGQTAIANPLFGTTTMHLAALFSRWGDARAEAFLAALRANGVRVAASNGEVKRLVTSGEVAFGLCDSDDAQEALRAHAPVKVIFPDQGGLGTLLMPTTATLIEGGPHPAAGQRLIDCLLGPATEAELAAAGGYMPLRPGVPTPPDVHRADGLDVMAVSYPEVAATMLRIEPKLREWVGL